MRVNRREIISKEEGKMKTTAATIRNVFCFLSLLALSAVLAACGGGGTDTSSNPSGIASVNVSLAAAPAFPAGTSFTATPTAVETAANPVSPGFDNVWVKIEKVALLPANEGEGPDPNGEVPSSNNGPDHNGGFVTGVVGGKVINLKDLPSGQAVARFLDQIVNVPAGTYGKIRVYYSELWGQKEGDPQNIDFHPTANSHFDVHFVNGDLVIPVTPDPDRGIHLFEVSIKFVGLKIVENKNKVLMRPQVFAELVNDVLYSVSGRAANVDSGEFDIVQEDPEVLPVHVLYGGNTEWSFWDPDEERGVDVGTANGTAALDNNTMVEAIGTFSGEGLDAQKITIIFEDFLQNVVVSGDSTNGWTPDNTVILNLPPPDNVVVPRPSRIDAVYDNADINSGYEPLYDTDVVMGATIKARGYFVTGVGIDAFWISIGP
jgi:hypothetical protein